MIVSREGVSVAMHWEADSHSLASVNFDAIFSTGKCSTDWKKKKTGTQSNLSTQWWKAKIAAFAFLLQMTYF